MENILLKNVARGIRYGVKPRQITPKWKFTGDKASYVNFLKEKYNLTIENIRAIKAQEEDSAQGYYVEFSGDSKSVFPLKAFENANVGIKLLNVKASEETLKATVYIPEEKEYKFNDKFDSYKETLSEEKQRAQDFVESVNDISAATLDSFWTSKPEYIPKEVPVWCELWVRYEITKKENKDYVKNETLQILQKLEIPFKEQFIEFPERLVFLVKVNRQKLEELIQKFPYVAELQKAAEVNTFFTEMSSHEQSEFIDETKRLVIEKKWFATLAETMITELQNVVQKIVTEVTDLQERYECTLDELETNCNTLSKKVAGYLKELE